MENKRRLLVLWTTGDCNLACRYCYAAGKSGRMSEETAQAALEQYLDSPVTVQFAGGEPLLNWEIIRYAAEYVKKNKMDARLQLQTNGLCVTRERAAFLRENQIAVGVSLDGIPEVNERLRGKTPQVAEGIRILASEGVHVNLNAVVTSENAGQLEQLVDFAWYLESVEGIGLDLLRAAGRGRAEFDSLLASDEQIRDALWKMEARSRQLAQISGRKLVIREVAEAAKRMKLGKRLDYCYASCGLAMAVLPDGSCYPCGSLAGNPDYYMGKVRDVAIQKETADSGDITGNGKKAAIQKEAADSGNIIENEKKTVMQKEAAYTGYDRKARSCLVTEKIYGQETCLDCPGREVCPGACPSRLILNGKKTSDCVLRRTAFEIAEKWYV